ncbi:MAG: PadR family transcriptional regulator [Candidatus Methanoplasma sp.]|jgi:DNA-binding PadR family transcriptional regulator|nr:PadR family transcriptional regulator [Candidatus Methanoplasma sp.]
MRPPGPSYKGHRISPVQIMILLSVRKDKKHGYGIIKDMRAHFKGIWDPKTGAIYPAIKKLQDMGLLVSEHLGGKEYYFMSEEGTEWLISALPILNAISSMRMRFTSVIVEVCEEMGIEASEIPDVNSMPKIDRLKTLTETRDLLEADLLRINEAIERVAGEKE